MASLAFCYKLDLKCTLEVDYQNYIIVWTENLTFDVILKISLVSLLLFSCTSNSLRISMNKP